MHNLLSIFAALALAGCASSSPTVSSDPWPAAEWPLEKENFFRWYMPGP